ncbi:MAG: hypothetical protein ACPGTU_16175 [Myxococcota bacterium]
MSREPWEHIVCTQKDGIYESHYLKANSPDGTRGLWIKHNLLRPNNNEGIGEFWIILFEQGQPPQVAKRHVEWPGLSLDEKTIRIESQEICLTPSKASGAIADISWELSLSNAGPPLLHFPWDWMYTAGFPKKKAISPAPHLVFNGHITVGDSQWDISDWIGLRGHNWGREHAHMYAYGNCHVWDDEQPRTVDGFSARIRIMRRFQSPLLSTIVARQPNIELNRPRHWFGGANVTPTSWTFNHGNTRLEMHAKQAEYAGLRYTHPDGQESYCYNTKFAAVKWTVGDQTFTSTQGELEVLFPEPLEGVALHPSADWNPKKGDYRG